MEGSAVLRSENQATMTTSVGMRIPTVKELLRHDLDYISVNLGEEFGRMAGHRSLTGRRVSAQSRAAELWTRSNPETTV